MKFKINLATKIYVNTRLLNFSVLSAMLVLSVLLILTVRHISVNAAKATRLNNEIAAFDSKFKTASKGVSEKEYHDLLDRIGFANAVIDKKTYNWLELLDRLEHVVPDGVAISSIDPNTKNRDLRLSGVARSFNNLRVFMEHLEDSKYFTDVYLAGQRESKPSEAAAQGISFDLTCKVAR